MHILSKPLLSAGPVGIIANRRVEVKIEQKPNLRSACKDALLLCSIKQTALL